MKKYISVFAIMLMIFLAACSNQNISSAPTSNESNTQSNSVTKLEEGVWPANEYTEGLPVPPGTVAWATLDVVRRHTSFEELTPTLLREFVEKIVVHECSYDENKTRRQDIEIYYSFVGKVDLPE